MSLAAGELAYGETTTASATVYDQNGGLMSGASLAWSSSDEAVATVASDGTVTATGVGEATITAEAGQASGGAQVAVVHAEHHLSTRDTTIAAFELLVVDVPSDLPLPDTTVLGVVGDAQAPLGASGDAALIGLLPDLGDGVRTLTVELDRNNIAHIEFTAVAAPEVADPEGVVDAAAAEMTQVVDSVVSVFAAEGDAEAAEGMGVAGELVDELRSRMAGASAEERLALAQFLGANPELLELQRPRPSPPGSPRGRPRASRRRRGGRTGSGARVGRAPADGAARP